MEENGLSVEDVLNGIKRIGKKEINQILETPNNQDIISAPKTNLRSENRQKMTSLRRKLSNRLVAVKNQTAMLTTFNEVIFLWVASRLDLDRERFFLGTDILSLNYFLSFIP